MKGSQITNTSPQITWHHRHATAKASFKPKKEFGTSQWSVILRTFYRQILSLLYGSFFFWNFRHRLARELLVYSNYYPIFCLCPTWVFPRMHCRVIPQRTPLWTAWVVSVLFWMKSQNENALWNPHGFCMVLSILGGLHETPRRSPGMFLTADLLSQISVYEMNLSGFK